MSLTLFSSALRLFLIASALTNLFGRGVVIAQTTGADSQKADPAPASKSAAVEKPSEAKSALNPAAKSEQGRADPVPVSPEKANASNPQLENSVQALHWVWTLAIFVLAGLIGGALGTLRYYDAAAIFKEASNRWKETEASKRKNALGYFVGAWVISGLGGIGGSLAALFFLIITNQILPRSSELVFFSWGFVAGFIGLQLLSLAADSLTKRIEDVAARKASETANREVDDLKKKIDANERELAIRAGKAVFTQKKLNSDPSVEDVEDARMRLRHQFEADKTIRRVVIVYANVLGYVAGRLDDAIAVLKEGFQAIPASSPSRTIDQAAMLHNAAFYEWKLSITAPDADKKRVLWDRAMADLKHSCNLDASLKTQARTDPDWAPIYDGTNLETDFLAATA